MAQAHGNATNHISDRVPRVNQDRCATPCHAGSRLVKHAECAVGKRIGVWEFLRLVGPKVVETVGDAAFSKLPAAAVLARNPWPLQRCELQVASVEPAQGAVRKITVPGEREDHFPSSSSARLRR